VFLALILAINLQGPQPISGTRINRQGMTGPWEIRRATSGCQLVFISVFLEGGLDDPLAQGSSLNPWDINIRE
jgi:hypothetical protein